MNDFEWIVVRSNLPQALKEVLLEIAEGIDDSILESAEEALDNLGERVDDIEVSLTELREDVNSLEEEDKTRKAECERCKMFCE